MLDLKMKTEKYFNRYGDEYTFTPIDENTILWEGSFEYHRYGHPNVYDDAYREYVRDGGTMSMPEFVKEIHYYDPETYESSEIGKTYQSLVYSNRNIISMVDPSGGPYLSSGMASTYAHSEVKDKTISHFVETKGGYKIILK